MKKKADPQNRTFALLVAADGHTECAAAMLAAGFSANQVNMQNGGFVLFMAAQNDHTECVAALLVVGDNVDQWGFDSCKTVSLMTWPTADGGSMALMSIAECIVEGADTDDAVDRYVV